ncbi:tRNA (guanosine(18)-2'-O)-methyltransferase TrmH [Alteromonas sp. KUL49]|uniref:tRNA (guanosine(18)-2'-O)-methyltransferase TrmH n=1 Tax=Alteromonas sp. KUL49 TaxID=2480798 RepID=UPI00102ED69F|nr:tRNA (guanosine(18)-2'-O)-methyltransferase TrmH [Alteromonas sp. KUL49]TAP39358.1 tRNA (guanosine(18)-2'-O)-methyltransferase TrmH [Alteromonas sp. KUL49]GEA12151.1 tRNA (guanosine(18)-2'-O)-methyltransferase [Alteromonas sp. KUL49]
MSPERYQRIRDMLAKRQTDLTVCLENVHKPHNVSAVVRTCDAIGIHRVHTVWEDKYKLRGGTAMGSQQWVRQTNHDTIGEAIGELKGQGMQVLVTHLSEKAVDFREIDYTKPTAVLFGQEKYGVTDEAIAMADQDIVIPMVGMVQSLNVSVAAALVLYEAQRQRELAGMYNEQHLAEEECQTLLFEGGYPRLVNMCKRKDVPYPPIDENGHIAADESWWQQMQMSKDALSALKEDEASK